MICDVKKCSIFLPVQLYNEQNIYTIKRTCNILNIDMKKSKKFKKEG